MHLANIIITDATGVIKISMLIKDTELLQGFLKAAFGLIMDLRLVVSRLSAPGANLSQGARFVMRLIAISALPITL